MERESNHHLSQSKQMYLTDGLPALIAFALMRTPTGSPPPLGIEKNGNLKLITTALGDKSTLRLYSFYSLSAMWWLPIVGCLAAMRRMSQ